MVIGFIRFSYWILLIGKLYVVCGLVVEPKVKRKASRQSVSGSEDAHETIKRKKSNSITNKSISSNNETNDETDEDKDLGPGSRSTSIIIDNDSSEKYVKLI